MNISIYCANCVYRVLQGWNKFAIDSTKNPQSSLYCWMFLIYCWMFLIYYWMFPIYCWLFLIYCCMFLVYCWMFLFYCLMFSIYFLMFLTLKWYFRLLSRADDLEVLMNEEVTDINELLGVINNIQVRKAAKKFFF